MPNFCQSSCFNQIQSQKMAKYLIRVHYYTLKRMLLYSFWWEHTLTFISNKVSEKFFFFNISCPPNLPKKSFSIQKNEKGIFGKEFT